MVVYFSAAMLELFNELLKPKLNRELNLLVSVRSYWCILLSCASLPPT